MERLAHYLMLFMFDVYRQIFSVKASGCSQTVGCPGDYFCCHGGTRCCKLQQVYQLWWFWFILVVILFLIISCILVLRRRRKIRKNYTRFNQTACGGTNTQPRNSSYPETDPPPPYPSSPPDQEPPPYQYPGNRSNSNPSLDEQAALNKAVS
ncbi:WW domain-binding protein 1-like [Ostrea edulis]|uniref:WW domain-binding protein 1-like n=1 Tax=Ostrea edulis TaxID=37623 RepID=UPI0024AF9052|nr:WW domain-binding protein 1-like [Ostrea edulis]XP_056018361.1 WW domain-binding protein 1-like [Ostrea edulis]